MILKGGATIPERVLALDIYGKLDAPVVLTTIVEVTKIKQANLPVIIILPSIAECEQLKSHFQHCFIFGIGRVAEQLSCLNQLNKLTNAPWPVILTTAEASLGHDLTAIAYVIQKIMPDSYSTFVQNAGRSNRVDPTTPLVGALITTAAVFDIESVK